MIVDAISSFIPTPESFAAAQLTLARLDGYLERFNPKLLEGRTRAEIEAAAQAAGRGMSLSDKDFFTMLEKEHIDLSVVYTEMYATSLGVKTCSNDEVAAYVAKNPTRLIGMGGVDPLDDASVADMERGVRELGMKGFVMSPFKQRLYPNDPRLMRVYVNCERLGVPILLHTGINWWKGLPYDIGHPSHVDTLANTFPKLDIVALHAFWPWVSDGVMVAWRHPNVYLDLSAHRPKHFAAPSSGWESLLFYGNRMIQDKVIFGTAWTLLGTPPGALADEVRALPLSEKVVDKWLGGNAVKLFKL